MQQGQFIGGMAREKEAKGEEEEVERLREQDWVNSVGGEKLKGAVKG